MKSTFLVLVLALAALGTPCFAGAVHLTGTVSADFLAGSSTQQMIDTFAAGDQPLFWGLGWEVIMGRVGFGGDYLVSFSQDAGEHWWLDWYAPALFVSFHPLGGKSFLDPFLELGVGSSGRVLLEPARTPMGPAPSQDLSLALFPFAGGGIAFNLDGFLLSVKAVYTPYSSQVPATDIPAYPLGKFQVTVSGGISIGW
jgi:hypothetical protein